MAGVTTALVRASITITLDAAGEATAAETIVIGGQTYTFNTTVGTTANSIHIGAAVAGTAANLVAAINASNEGETAVAAADYGSLTVRNPSVYATIVAATGVITLHAHVPGSIGNHITVAQGTSTITLGGTVLASGTGNIAEFFDELLGSVQLNSEALQHLAPFSIDEGGLLD